MSKNKQSSVIWAIEQYSKIHSLWVLGEIGVQNFNRVYNEILEQAKAMHKKEIMKTLRDGKFMVIVHKENKSLEQYYNETYGDNNN